MKIKVAENLNPINVIRRAGYGLVRDVHNPHESYARRLGSGVYPRFHVYLESTYINLHLDQKQASYQGSSAHSGEYDGDTVEREGERIKKTMVDLLAVKNEPELIEQKSFWQKIF